MVETAGELAQAWRVSCATTSALLEAVPDDALDARFSPRTRTVASQFAHVHNIRVSQVEHRAPDRLGRLAAFPRGAEPTRARLRRALADSERALAGFLDDCEAAGRVKGWHGPPTSFLGYLIAHEAHHRGQALVALRLSGTKLPKSVTYGLWAWGRKDAGARR